MELIWITLIILANIFIYIRKIILARHGYKIPWLVVWGEWKKFMDIIEANNSPAERKLLFALNIAPYLLFALGIMIAILDWMRHEPWLIRIMTAAL